MIEEIKKIIADKMMQAKRYAEKYGDIPALWEIGMWYKYASDYKEKAAMHIIIQNLSKNPEAKPHLPSLPQLETLEG